MLRSEDLITDQELEAIMTKQGVERGREVAFTLRDKIRESDDPNACLLTIICEIFESEDVDNATLKKHGESMRASISNGTAATPVQVPAVTPSAPPHPSAAALPRTNPNELGIGDLDIVLSVLANELVPTATVSSNGSSRSTSSASMQTVSTSNTDNGKRSLGIKDAEKAITVLNEAQFGPVNWNDLGLKLGLFSPRLNVIGEGGGDAYRHLRKTIEAWLKGEDNVTSRTWQTLIDAVEGTGDRAAAERIPKKLKTLYNITL
ncbi:PREDICTED: uncharacterized protein LOC109584007 [Amphimedon queenslandica]|uniref:Death domain-containing protein n=1 Tax=Amphimedon queenslandica TaxID=400682 RepID=A0AAN0JED4_AMPQE|nr:PREDICTED: uncharacterized protein LOC109584007 [Amphimedon queenslandica]|eukprot:XP_019855122.1 PREDICTED: uncharacterized protein LOC109584007 [Amphimedon queenslandica]